MSGLCPEPVSRTSAIRSTCIDKDAGKIARLEAGEIPIFEPGLDDLVARNVREGRLLFTVDAAEAVRDADAVFIAVGTPSRRGDGHADLSYVYAAAEEIAGLAQGFTVVVTKSTVPVGTGDEIEAILKRTRTDGDFAVVSNPEFLREGAAINDFKRPDRVVVGTEDERAKGVMNELYRPLFLNETPILFTSRRTSELTKYAANAFLAMKITFINEMADLCEALDADVQQVARGIGLDKRIGSKFLHAGPGYGGSCFPKGHLGPGAHRRRRRRPDQTGGDHRRGQRRAQEGHGRQGRRRPGRRRARQADRRPGPDLQAQHRRHARRPFAGHHSGPAGQGRHGAGPSTPRATRRGACCPGRVQAGSLRGRPRTQDVLVILTEWDQFRAMDLDRVKQIMRRPLVVDLRNIYRPAEMAAKGFEYKSVGRA